MLEIFKRLCKPKHQDEGLSSEAVETLRKHLCEINENFPMINRGGCVFFAHALKNRMEELGHEAKFFIVSNTDIVDLIEKRTDNSLSAINSCGAYLYHMMCKVGDYVIDSTGVYSDFKNTYWGLYTGKEIGKEEVIKDWLNEREVWNPSFNQGDLPKIYEKIKAITI